MISRDGPQGPRPAPHPHPGLLLPFGRVTCCEGARAGAAGALALQKSSSRSHLVSFNQTHAGERGSEKAAQPEIKAHQSQAPREMLPLSLSRRTDIPVEHFDHFSAGEKDSLHQRRSKNGGSKNSANMLKFQL